MGQRRAAQYERPDWVPAAPRAGRCRAAARQRTRDAPPRPAAQPQPVTASRLQPSQRRW